MSEGAADAEPVLRAIGVGVWDWSIATGVVRHGPVFAEILGLDPARDGHSNVEVLDRIHPEDARAAALALDRALLARGLYASEHRVRRPDGSEAWVEDVGRVVEHAPDGRPLRMIGALRDVTEARRLRRALAESEARFREAAAALPGAIFSYRLKPDGTDEIGYMSEGSTAIWELTPEEIAADASRLWSMIEPEDVPGMAASIRESATTLRPWSWRWRLTTPSGRRKWILGRGAPYPQPDGGTLWHSFLIDVTDQVKLEEEVARSQRMLAQARKMEAIGALTGGMAHDFNNLLSVILGNLELMQEDEDPARRGVYMREAVAATLRGRDLTRSLLAVARRAPLAPSRIGLETMLRDIEPMLRRTLPATVTLHVAAAPGLWPVEADRSGAESAVLNLAVNARDAMPAGGRLTIEASNVALGADYVDGREETIAPGRYVSLSVTDTGTGMTAEVAARAFDPFFTTKPVGEGSGLGLAMVAGFARQSGGAARLYSEPGVGTTVRLLLPAAADAAAEAGAAPAAVDPAPRAARILLVEDDPAVRRAMAQRLRLDGHDVTEAGDGAEALTAFESGGRFDLVLTDVVMPGPLQGPALARRLRALSPDQRIAFMSGYPGEAAVHGNGLAPGDLLLVKPISRADLWAAIRQALA